MRLFLGILWTSLLFIGIDYFHPLTSNGKFPFWIDYLMKFALIMVTLWVYFLLYDIWVSTRVVPEKYKNVSMESIIDIDGVLYKVTQYRMMNYGYPHLILEKVIHDSKKI